MQSFSPPQLALVEGVPLAASPQMMEFMKAMREASMVERPWWFFVVNLLLTILSIWASGRLFAGSKGTFGRAILVFLGWLAAGFVIGLAIGLSVALAAAKLSGAALLFLGIVFLLLVLVVAVGVPSVVFEMNVPKSIGFVVIYVVLGIALQTGFEILAFGQSSFRIHYLRDAVNQMRQPTADSEAVRAQLRERQDALYRRHEVLEIHRLHLPAGDKIERERYEREKAAYEADLADLRDEAAKLPPPP